MTDNKITREEIEKGVGLLWPGEHSWDLMLYSLRRHPVNLLNNTEAELVSEIDEEEFIFNTKSWKGEQWWRVTTPSSSFGDRFNATLDEVREVKVERTDWELV